MSNITKIAYPSPQNKPRLQLLLASPRGFCAGVLRAVQIVEQALEKYGKPVYVRHEIVHNRAVVKRLADMGAVFVEELDQIPGGNQKVIFSAHGVAPDVISKAKSMGFFVIDATCPLVSKIHAEVRRYKKNGQHVFLIGHRNHPEIIGTIGHIGSDGWSLIEKLEDVEKIKAPIGKTAYATQTTLSVNETKEIIAALKKRFVDIASPNSEDICYATTNRQNVVRDIAPQCDLFLILGADNSSNAKRLVETAELYGAKKAELINNQNDINWDRFNKNEFVLGLSAGASTPSFLVDEVVAAFKKRFEVCVKNCGDVKENVVFKIPEALR